MCGTWDKTTLKLLWQKQRQSARKEFITVLHAFIAKDCLKRLITIKNEIASFGSGLGRAVPVLVIR